MTITTATFVPTNITVKFPVALTSVSAIVLFREKGGGVTPMTIDTNVQFDLFDGEDRRPLAAHIWAKAEFGFYVEPEWCSKRLFQVEEFTKSVWDPCCGIGRI